MTGVGVEGNAQVSRFPRPSLVPLLLACAGLVIVYFTITTARNIYHNHQLAQQEVSLRRDIAQLKSDHQQLIAIRDYLQSDEYIEYNARRVLGLVKPGQTLVVVSSDATAAAASPTPPPMSGQWWKDLFPAVTPAPTTTP